LIARAFVRAAAPAAALALACTAAVVAATPAPRAATPPPRINVLDVQPKSLAPKRALHAEYTFEVNRLGQVSRVRSVKPSHDEAFDAHTYGNVLQMFIRLPDGRAIPGVYRIAYDYDPKSLRVRRGEPQLVRAGGVNPNAKGAVDDMLEIARRNSHHAPTPGPAYRVTPGPVPSVNIKRMPDLPQVMRSPTPAPHG
jgi:hypothetical protein